MAKFEKIKGCPVCKSSSVGLFKSWGNGFFLSCGVCPFKMTHALPTKAQAIKSWNDRENRRAAVKV